MVTARFGWQLVAHPAATDMASFEHTPAYSGKPCAALLRSYSSVIFQHSIFHHEKAALKSGRLLAVAR